jgi:hypothetical protein
MNISATRMSGIITPLNMSANLNFGVSNFYPLTYLRGGMFISLMLASLICKSFRQKNIDRKSMKKRKL